MSNHAHRPRRPRRDRRDNLAIALFVSKARGCICELHIKPRHLNGVQRISVLHDAWCPSTIRGTTLVIRPERER
jgi:hypothetical protein